MKIIKYIILILFPFFFIGCNDKIKQQMESAIKYQMTNYPESRLQDIYKNFYQDRFGSEHLISDKDAVYRYTEQEIEMMDTSYCPLIEEIGWEHNFVRVNLEYLKQNNISSKFLSDAFIESSTMGNKEQQKNWIIEWNTIISVIEKNNIQIKNFADDKKNIDSILNINPRAAVHHSKNYNENYKPHYRVVEKTILKKVFDVK